MRLLGRCVGSKGEVSMPLATGPSTMETRKEFAEAQARKFLTVLFAKRARRHLKALAEIYGWSHAMLAEYEERFIKSADVVPIFTPT